MRILIADDERLIRMNLISMIEELYDDVHKIDEAKDGNELLEMLTKHSYELVFVDINMPKKNGLQAIEEAKSKNPNVNWCVLSGYTDFEYAKKAISLGVKEYLLKPLDIDELKRFMDSIISEIAEKRWREHLLYEKKVDQVFSLADSSDIILPLEREDGEKEYSLFVFFVDVANKKRRKYYREIYKGLSEYVFEHIDKSDNFALFYIQTGELCLLMEGSDHIEIQSYFKMGQHDIGMQKIVTVYVKDSDFETLYEGKQKIIELAPLHIMRENLEMVSIDEWIDKSQEEFCTEFCEKFEQITGCYVTDNYEEALEMYYEVEADEQFETCYNTIDRDAMVSYLSITWGISFESTDYKDILNAIKHSIKEQIRSKGGQNNQLIDGIKKYVKDNFGNNMSIAEIGDYFNITPSYISRVFKEKTGEKLIDYITGIRMKKAKELLLSEPHLSIKEIADQVGYSSEKHFSKTFRKRYNCLPSKYLAENKDEK